MKDLLLGKFINIIKYMLTIMLTVICVVAVYIVMHITNDGVTVTQYDVKADISSAFRIVQISDFHCTEFGDNNAELVELVKKQNPDIIVLSGDMINCFEEDITRAERLVSDLSKITTVYFGFGNHEFIWERRYGKKLTEAFTKAGAKVLNNTYEDVSINGSRIRIGGYMGYYRTPWMFKLDDEEAAEQYRFFDDFENTGEYKILINHIPTAWLDWNHNDRPVDLVFSGHYHGGQIVLPFYGALYAPYIGFQPPFTKGKFVGEYATVILSSGVGNEYWFLPRINNFPEIVVVDLNH